MSELNRRSFLLAGTTLASASGSMQGREPVRAEVRFWKGKPTLFVRAKPIYASFYALTDCPGGRWSWDEAPRQSIRQFVEAGFRLFQVDLFLEDCWTQPGRVSIELARRQIRGILDLCPDAAVVIRWHLNMPGWWKKENPGELTRYANGDFELIERTQPVRIIQDDLRRTPRASIASDKWIGDARAKTEELLRDLARTNEGAALAGIHVACGVYGEWHYWGFMRNEPDVSEPMQKVFRAWRAKQGRLPIPVPDTEARRALDDGIFRDPIKREAVIDYYRCQQELVADRILDLCATVKRSWPRPILAGTFYGYFFSMFNRQATGGHLCLHQLLQSPYVDYLSAPQAYGETYRDLGNSGITRGLIESVRVNGKLFLDEMDQTPSWTWLNNVDTAFRLTDVEADIAILRRNVLESYTRGAGLWYYDFGPANQTGWWLDNRLMAEAGSIRKVLDEYHQREYQPAGDVLFVFDTEVFYFTGSTQGTDSVTDPLAVNRTIIEAWAAGAAIETIHLADLERIDLSRFRLIVFANTWLMTERQRRFVREVVATPKRHVLYQGPIAYCDGKRLSIEFSREMTGLDLRIRAGISPAPAFTAGDAEPGLSRHGNIWFAPAPPLLTTQWRRVFTEAGAHLYTNAGDIVHAGGGVVLIHSKPGGPRSIRFRSGKSVDVTMPPKSSLLFDGETGARLL